MIRIWIFVVLSAALAQTSDLGPSTNIYGKLEDGCHDCYPCGHDEVKNYQGKINSLSLIDGVGRKKMLCCKLLSNSVAAKRGEPRPFCSGFIIDANVKVIVTSATCARKYPGDPLVVTFTRSLETASDVINVLVHEEYDEAVPLVNSIALLYRDQRKEAPDWVVHACTTGTPPLQNTYCVVMSDQDYFIDTIVPAKRKYRVGKMIPHVSQMYTQFIKGDFEPEMGAGLFCRDRMRTKTNEYYAYGITLQVSDEEITYTNVSHFVSWFAKKI